jgi:OmpA-OmpF porin, OOP family
MHMNFSRIGLAAGTLGLILGTPAFAEQQWPESFGYLGVQGSYYDIEDGRDAIGDVENYWQPAVNLGYRFNPRFSAQLQYGKAETSAKNINLDVDAELASIVGRLHFPEWSVIGFQPYAGLGYGRNELDPEVLDTKKEDMVVGELGLQRLLSRSFMLDLGVRGLLETDDRFFDSQPYIGLSWLFGKRYAEAPAPKPAPRNEEPLWIDSDGDGVPDHLDQCPDTPAGALVDDVGCHLVLTETVNITLHVEFDHDSTTVKQGYLPEIQEVAQVLTQYPGAEVLLEGHTDSTGSATYNQNLSVARANAVMRVLISEFGIGAERIRTSGMGESQPIADNGTAEGRAQNRRVEAVIQASREEIQMR